MISLTLCNYKLPSYHQVYILSEVGTRYNPTSWWSLWECAKVVFQEWRHIPAFLANNEEFGKKTTQKLAQALAQEQIKLRVELAAVMELEKFVQATYTLERDGTLVFVAFEELEELKAYIHFHNFPTLVRVIQELGPVNYGERQRWYQYGVTECLMPVFEYDKETFPDDPIVSLSTSVFRTTRLFNPKFVKLSSPVATDIDSIGEGSIP